MLGAWIPSELFLFSLSLLIAAEVGRDENVAVIFEEC